MKSERLVCSKDLLINHPEKHPVRYFNIAGPCNIKEHCMIDSLKRGGQEMLKLYRKYAS